MVRCPGCKEPFLPSLPSSELTITHIPIDTNDRPVPRDRPNRRTNIGATILALAATMPVAFAAGFFSRKAPNRVQQEKIEEQKQTVDDFDRLISPVTSAARYWSEPIEKLRNLCLRASEELLDQNHPVGPGEIASMLILCGRAECEWRGPEKCSGPEFAARLYADMILEGAKPENALRIVTHLHRVKPGDAQHYAAKQCDSTRRSIYDSLKHAKIISIENYFDQLLSNVDLVRGNTDFIYHRQTD